MPSASVVDWSEFNTWCYVRSTGPEKRKGATQNSADSVCASCRNNNRQQCSPSPKGFDITIMKGFARTHHTCIQNAYAQFAAGAVGGGTATYTTHWLDTIKVKMQTFPADYRSGAACLRHTLREEGVRGLYHGAAPAVLSQATKAAIVFCAYGLCEEMVRALAGKQSTDNLLVYEHATAGAMTGVVASFFLCPMELIKCRLQAMHQLTSIHSNANFRPPLALAREVLREEGIRGLYRGLNGIWVKEIPGSFIYFGSYEASKSITASVNPSHKHANLESFGCGMFAGLCFCITHPVESVKTRVQVMSAVNQSAGFFSSFAKIIRSEGLRPLCSGLRPCMLRASIYSGIQFLMYERVKSLVTTNCAPSVDT